MKTIFFLLTFISVTTCGFAQRRFVPDSIQYYREEVETVRRTLLDSLHQTTLYQNYNRVAAKSDDYRAMAFYVGVHSADFDRLRAQAPLFSGIKSPALGFGVGYSFKKGRRIFDLNVAAAGLEKKMKHNAESIRTSFGSLFQLELGYDVTKGNRVNLYPYAGIGFRMERLRYKSAAVVNPGTTLIPEIITSNASFDELATSLGYQAGLAFEKVLSRATERAGTILFIKAGTNRAFKQKAFDIEGVKYQPGLQYGNLSGAVGIKMFVRR